MSRAEKSGRGFCNWLRAFGLRTRRSASANTEAVRNFTPPHAGDFLNQARQWVDGNERLANEGPRRRAGDLRLAPGQVVQITARPVNLPRNVRTFTFVRAGLEEMLTCTKKGEYWRSRPPPSGVRSVEQLEWSRHKPDVFTVCVGDPYVVELSQRHRWRESNEGYHEYEFDYAEYCAKAAEALRAPEAVPA